MAIDDGLVELASRLADLARPIAVRHFRSTLAVEDKEDESPVTVADRQIETVIRETLTAERPDDGILGEEYGAERLEAEYVWVLDPIDGTKSFATGKPLFGVLIGLAREDRAALGVVDMPALGERWIGGPDHPTTFNGAPIRTRACEDLSGAWCHATTPDMFLGADETAFRRLKTAVKHTLYGGDCHAYGLLASGHVDLVVEARLKPYDFMGPAGVILGAGGAITDWRGEPLSLRSDGRVIAAGDSVCHRAALDLLRA